jgi:GPI mannosyltransferase 3
MSHDDRFARRTQLPFGLADTPRALLALALLVHLVAAYFSLSYWQFDEHFQLLEPLNEKLGRTPHAELGSEFFMHMRPYVEIGFLYGVSKLFGGVLGHSPIWLERLFRLLASLGGLWVCVRMLSVLQAELRTSFARRAAAFGLLLYWPIVFMHARISAEAVAGTLFWAGWLGCRRKSATKSMLLSGLLIGIAFMLRIQVVLAMAGLGLWLLLVRTPLRGVLTWIGGILLGVGIGVLCDWWGYGVLTFTPWNYFRENILHGMAARFGIEPWWWYFAQATVLLGVVFGALAVLAILWFWARRPMHPAALPTLFFVVGHSLIGHKEERFLLPALPLIPIAIAHALDTLPDRSAWLARTARGLAYAYLALDIVLLPAMILRPASLPLYYFKYLDTHYRNGYAVLWDERDPLLMGGSLAHYYEPRSYTPERVRSIGELEARLHVGPYLYFRGALELPDSAILRAQCTQLVSTVPWWMNHPRLVAAVDPSVRWSLYQCRQRL